MPAAGLIFWLGYGKFYSLFSLLFGIGFSLQLVATEDRGDARLAVFRRRLLVLLAIGALHLYIWEGDILFLYALVGFLLIPFRRVKDATLVRAAVALVLAPVALEALIVQPRRAGSRRAAAASGRFGAPDDGLFAGDAALPSAARCRVGRVSAVPAQRSVLSVRGSADHWPPVQGAGDVPGRSLGRTLGHAPRSDTVAAHAAAGALLGLRIGTPGRRRAGSVDGARNARRLVAEGRQNQ